MQLARVQKERDQFSDELETLKERSESSQTLLQKAARDREAMQTDLEVLKERYEKSHIIQQKLQVIAQKFSRKFQNFPISQLTKKIQEFACQYTKHIPTNLVPTTNDWLFVSCSFLN